MPPCWPKPRPAILLVVGPETRWTASSGSGGGAHQSAGAPLFWRGGTNSRDRPTVMIAPNIFTATQGLAMGVTVRSSRDLIQAPALQFYYFPIPILAKPLTQGLAFLAPNRQKSQALEKGAWDNLAQIRPILPPWPLPRTAADKSKKRSKSCNKFNS